MKPQFLLLGAGQTGKWLAARFKDRVAAFIDETSNERRIVAGRHAYHPSNLPESFRHLPIYVSIFQPKHSFDLTGARILKSFGLKCLPMNELFNEPELDHEEYLFLSGRSKRVSADTLTGAVLNLFDDEESKVALTAFIEMQGGASGSSKLRKDRKYLQPLIGFLSHADLIIDAGAFDGDTLIELEGLCPNPNVRLLGLEPDPNNFTALCGSKISSRPETILLQKALWTTSGVISFNADSSMASRISETGEIKVQSVCLRDLPITSHTFIKLDLEGADLPVFEESRDLLSAIRPAFGVSVYHRPDDWLRFAKVANELRHLYSFYLRFHGFDGMDLTAYGFPKQN